MANEEFKAGEILTVKAEALKNLSEVDFTRLVELERAQVACNCQCESGAGVHASRAASAESIA